MTENASAKHSVLVVDDELLIRDLLYDFFLDRSWDVTVTGSAEKALQQIEARDFDVLLTDLKMPEMDGSTLIDKVRTHRPDMPVIVITGYPSIESAVRSLRQKVDDYLTKPFNVTKLYKTVEATVTKAKNSESRQ